VPTIYLVYANPFPEKPLKIDIEMRSIFRRLPASWDIKLGPAARMDDIVSDLRRFDPDVVHFSSHGSPTERLILLNSEDKPEEVSRATIENLFSVMKGKIRLVVLNACYSQSQAEQIRSSVDCIVAVSSTLADTNAILYSGQFYEALSAGRSVYQAHQEAGIILTDVPASHKPQLLVRDGIDAAAVRIVLPSAAPALARAAPPAAAYIQSKKMAFEQAKGRYGVSAESFTILKITNPDGSYILRYEIEGLRSLYTEMTSLSWRFASTAGVVMGPALDRESLDAGIDWDPEENPGPISFDDVLKNVATLRGKFTFDPPLQPDHPQSFTWTTQVLNGDALTAWEFENLYSKKEQVHVSKKRLIGNPSEYFAHLVWFPVERLNIGLRLPPSQLSPPKLRYFELKKKDSGSIPADLVMQDGDAWMYPKEKTPWAEQNASWQRNRDIESQEDGASSSSAQAELTVPYPVLGSYYSLDWTLPDPPLPADIDRLRGQTEEIRDRLLSQRAARLSGPVTPFSEEIRRLFEEVHNEARAILSANEASFSTTLMIWDRESRRMVVVEVSRNDGNVPGSDWQFSLPFGLGLAGMCFRTATGAFRYQRDLDRGDPKRPEMYLPVPGGTRHTFLLCLPIDHPEMTEEMANQPDAQRCRQLIGALSLGSASPASNLREYCRLELTDGAFARLRGLRDSLQKKVDAISNSMLEAAGLLNPPPAVTIAPPPAPDISTAAGAKPAISLAGLIHQPAPEWVSPVRGNRFQSKVAAFDFDGTLLRGEQFVFSWEAVWQSLGFGKTIRHDLKRQYRQQAAAARSQVERTQAYQHWCDLAVESFKSRGLTREQLRAISQTLRLTVNCREALKALRENSVVTALISGGISAVLEDTFPDYRDYFDFVFMNELVFGDSGIITGVRATAYDFEGKADALSIVCARAGATLDETVFVGDHFNDEAIMLQVKTAIAYPPNDAVAETVSHKTILKDDLLSVIPYILLQS
jgi:HAD superfamily phosphoserine phosphatase-like hydrolase